MRNSLSFISLVHSCVVRLVILCLPICHPETNTLADTMTYSLPSQAHTFELVKLTLSFTMHGVGQNAVVHASPAARNFVSGMTLAVD